MASAPAPRLVSSFAKGAKLGEGTYGSVYEAVDRDSGALVALKRVKERSSGDREGMPITSLREIALLKQLRHPNIVRLLEVAVGSTSDSVFLVFEHCEHELARLIDSGWRMPLADAKCAVRDLLKAVAHLHVNGILHRDLKLSNLLVSREGVLKLCDFGLARETTTAADADNDDGAYTPKVVTLWYRAPELLLGGTRYGRAVDMWSCGCILGEVLLHKPLLPGASEKRQLELICELLGTPSERIWPALPSLPLWRSLQPALPKQDFNDLPTCFATNRAPRPSEATLRLLNALLTFDPTKRLSAAAALKHAWFEAELPRPAPRLSLPPSRATGQQQQKQQAQQQAQQQQQQAQRKRPREEPTRPPQDVDHHGGAASTHLRTAPADSTAAAAVTSSASASSAGAGGQSFAIRIPSPADVLATTARQL